MQKTEVPPTTDAASVLERLFELAVQLGDAMEWGLQQRGLTRARAELLWRLGQSGPLTQQALSELLRCTPRNVTGLVDPLQEAGFVARSPHPNDRRATLVSLSDEGRNAVAAMLAGYRQLATRLFGDVPEEELASFVNILDRVLGRLRESDAGTAD